MKKEDVIPGIIAAALVGLVATLAVLSSAHNQDREWERKHEPPCGYGASEMMVREKDGSLRIVCGCPR
jgi:hypothetical protein